MEDIIAATDGFAFAIEKAIAEQVRVVVSFCRTAHALAATIRRSRAAVAHRRGDVVARQHRW